jgi:hypothetical protein
MDAEGAKVVRRMPHLAKNYERLVQLDLRCVQIAKFLFYYTTLAIDRDMLLFPAVVAQVRFPWPRFSLFQLCFLTFVSVVDRIW